MARSVAGASAQREYKRRAAAREAKFRAAHPRTAGLILALKAEPQSIRSWATGAEGERLLGADLDSLQSAGIIALHDRRRPASRANIDHLAVSPSGVWVIDAKRYDGQVTRRRDGWLSDVHLYVGRRDCSKLVSAMAPQVDAVRTALDEEWAGAPVRPMLCFVGASWPLFAKPFELDDVVVTWPAAACRQLRRPGPYSAAEIEQIAARLDRRLRPAA